MDSLWLFEIHWNQDFITAIGKQYKLAIISYDSSRCSKYLRKKFDINKFFGVISISGDLKIQEPDECILVLQSGN